MKTKLATLVGLLTIIAAIVGFHATQGGARPMGAPPVPPWVRADGSIDPAQLDRAVGVAGPNGAPVVCGNGNRLKVKVRDLFEAPPVPANPDAGPNITGGVVRGTIAIPAPVGKTPPQMGRFGEAKPLRADCGADGKLKWRAMP